MLNPALHVLAAACVLLASLALGGCKAAPASPGSAAAGVSALAGDWTVTHVDGKPLTIARPPTLAFNADGRVSGFTGVNRLTSTIDTAAASSGQFKLSPTAVTRMAGPPESMAVESAFLAALNRATSYALEGDTLTLRANSVALIQLARAK